MASAARAFRDELHALLLDLEDEIVRAVEADEGSAYGRIVMDPILTQGSNYNTNYEFRINITKDDSFHGF